MTYWWLEGGCVMRWISAPDNELLPVPFSYVVLP